MIGLSTSGSISLGCAFVAGRKRVPSPAAGNTAFRTCTFMHGIVPHETLSGIGFRAMLDPAYVRDHTEEVRTAFRNRGLQADAELEQLATLEARRRRLIPELEGLKR